MSIVVYHVVTERPMVQGQELLFDETHHNGVYDRVMTFQKIINGEPVHTPTADLIRKNLDKWSKVAYRELALEKIRRAEFPQYPSRMACLYTSQTLEEAQNWAGFFKNIGRDVYSIVKLRVYGRTFSGDACNCFDGVADETVTLPFARRYWQVAPTEKPVIETIADGRIVVEELVEKYK